MKKSFKNQLRNLKKSVKKSLSEKICYTLKLTLTVFQNYWNSIRVRHLRELNSRYDLLTILAVTQTLCSCRLVLDVNADRILSQ